MAYGIGGRRAPRIPAVSTVDDRRRPLAPSTTAIVFSAVGQIRTVTVSHADHAGALRAVSSDADVATVTPSDGCGPAMELTVVAKSVGSCTITLSGDGGRRAVIAIIVARPASTMRAGAEARARRE